MITTIYDASLGTLPQAQGFTANIDSHITPSISGGILEVNAYSGGVDSRPGYYTGENGTFLLDSFVMAADLQIIHSTQYGSPGNCCYPRAGFDLTATDNNGRAIQLNITDSGLWLATSDGTAINPPTTAFYTFNTTDAFHDYRVEGDGTALRLYIDHSSTAALTFSFGSLQVASGATHSSFDFGDSSILARSDYKLKYALFSSDVEASVAPEPGTFALIPAAGLAFWLARRRKRA